MSQDREVLFEYLVLGNCARVAAIDAATGVEAIAQGPANALRADLELLALNLLRRRLAETEPAKPSRPGAVA